MMKLSKKIDGFGLIVLLLTTLLVIINSSLLAQSDYKIERITTEDGLSHDCIQCVYQDSKGFIWIGTEGGLNRYDGYNILEYINDPEDSNSISDNKILTIYENPADSGKILWIGSKGGLNKFDRATEEFSLYQPASDTSGNSGYNQIECIYEDKKGNLWAAGSGLNKFDMKTGEFTTIIENKNDPIIFSIIEDRSHNLWLGTTNGLLTINPKSTQKEINDAVCSPLYPKYSDGSNVKLIPSVFEDKNGVLWVGTRNGLFIYEKEFKQFLRPKFEIVVPLHYTETIWSISEDSLGYIWGATQQGIIQINSERDNVIYIRPNIDTFRFLENENYINASSLSIDRSGIIWVGTFCNGINRIFPNRNKFKHFRNIEGDVYSLGDNWVASFYEDQKGLLWIGTHFGLLNRYDGKRFLQIGPAWRIYSICAATSGGFWYTSLYGLINYDPARGKFNEYLGKGRHFSVDVKVYDNADKNEKRTNQISDSLFIVYSQFARDDLAPAKYCYVDKSRVIWCLLGGADSQDLHQFEPVTMEYIPYEIIINNKEINTIKMLFEDDLGTIWFGTEGDGLIKRNRYKGKLGEWVDKYVQYKRDKEKSNTISDDHINAILKDSKGNLWIGTNFGLNKFDPESESFSVYTTENGLVSNYITSVLEDNSSNLWISTNKGLSKLDYKTKRFITYDENDGFQTYIETGYKGRSGTMYFGGKGGFSLFHPDEVTENPNIPNVIITDFQLFNKSIEQGEESSLKQSIELTNEIILEYDQDVFTFEFTALDFMNPSKNLYAYKMDGVNPDWVYTDASRRFATYTKLDPGEYMFRVKASNNDGIWNEEGTSISIKILPPWWLTFGAYLIYTILFIGVLSYLYYLQRKRLKVIHRLEMQQFENEKLKEIDTIKSRFFANISHEFRTPLTLIYGPAKDILEKSMESDTKKNIGIIKKSAKRLERLVNQLLDLSRLEAGKMKLETSEYNIIMLLKGLVFSFTSLAEKNNLILMFRSSEDKLNVFVDKEKLEKIVNNLLSNAFKFTHEGGKIIVTVEKTKDYVEIKISDTGIGIPVNRIDKIFDRFYQVDGSHTRKGEGTGIGLALTKELVDLHKGKIFVESNKEKGTTFTVSLPLGRNYLCAEEIIKKESKKGNEITFAESEFVAGSENITEKQSIDALFDSEKPLLLIVEDNLDVRKYIVSSLVADYRILEAVDGKDGLTKSLKQIPDLIISDVMMPQMDGFELCNKLKTDERTSHIPIIILTAKAASQDKIEGYRTGADDYIMKPFDTNELRIRINNLLEQRKRLQEHLTNEGLLEIDNKTITSTDKIFLKKVCDTIQTHISDTSFSVDVFADELGMSRSQLRRKLVALVGEPPSDLTRRFRLTKAAKLIENKFGNISEIALEVGFNNPANFAISFRKQFNLSPTEYLKNSRS